MSNEPSPNDSASGQAARDEAEWQAWAGELGLPAPPKFRDESLAPPVDEQLLRTLLRRDLPEYKARGVLILVVSFRSWYEAYRGVMLDEYHGGNDECRMTNEEGSPKSE